MYENIPLVYYQCGRLGHADECCWFSEGDPALDSGDFSILQENIVIATGEASLEALIPLVPKGKGGGGQPRFGHGWPPLGSVNLRHPESL